jgi:hypothetical protein
MAIRTVADLQHNGELWLHVTQRELFWPGRSHNRGSRATLIARSFTMRRAFAA